VTMSAPSAREPLVHGHTDRRVGEFGARRQKVTMRSLSANSLATSGGATQLPATRRLSD
jgi:hypothetical protein